MPTSFAQLAAVFLLARPRLGVMLALAISTSFTSVVALSAWVGLMRGLQLDAFIAQSLFLISS